MKTKTLLSVAFVLALAVVFAIGAFAAEGNLWAEKPTSKPPHSGWVVNGREGHTGTASGCEGNYTTHTPTNIKWEVYADGSGYALYLSIDNEGYAAAYPDGKYKDNTIVYAYTFENSDNTHGNSWGGTGGGKHPWSGTSGIAINKFTKIVIGDGITQLKDGTFVGMHMVTVAELPTSLTSFSGSPFKGCAALSMIYTRGQTPKANVFNLSNVKNHYPANYYFSGCANVKQYIFAEDATMSNLSWGGFRDNTMLESFTAPGGATFVDNDCFDKCTNLKSVVIPASVTSVDENAFGSCTSLKEVTFLGNTSIQYDTSATTKEEVTSADLSNSFKGCPALETIKAPAGTKAADFAAKFGFATLADMKPTGDALYTGWVVNGDDGHEEGTTSLTCKGTLSTHAKTNIKWEIYNEGTDAAPYYTLYFSIDNEGYEASEYYNEKYLNNTVLYAFSFKDISTSNAHGFGWSTVTDGHNKHSWVSESGIAASKFKKIVIGDGITECRWGTFAAMTGVTILEMPQSLVKFDGGVLKGCAALSTVYTRGQSAVEGVFNLSNIKTIVPSNYAFAGCKVVKKYIFAEAVTLEKLTHSMFRDNILLEEITIPNGPTGVNENCFDLCTNLKSVTLPASVTGTITKGAFGGCTSLKEINFGGDANISYDSTATDKAGVVSSSTANAFKNCSALEIINAPVGSRPHQFALEFGFNTSHVMELYNTDGKHLCAMTFYPETGRMTIESHYSDLWEWTPATEEVRTFVTSYMGLAKNIVFTGKFGKIHTRDRTNSSNTTFYGSENLVSICFPKDARIVDYAHAGYSFANCPISRPSISEMKPI